MLKSKLLNMLQNLDPRQASRFSEFINSPYLVKNTNLVGFANLVMEKYPQLDQPELDKKIIFEQLFKGQPFEESRINDLMSYMVTALQDFLSTEVSKSDELATRLYLLEGVRKQEYSKEFERLKKQTAQKLNEGNRDARYYFYTYRLEHEADQYDLARENRELSTHLQKKMNALDIFYLVEKLKTACEMINRQTVFSATYHIPLQEVLLAYISGEEELLSIPALSIYYYTLLCLTQPDDEKHFHKLLPLLEENTDRFSAQEMREMYDYAQNYCIRKINNGQPAYNRQLLLIYRKLLDSQLIFENGYLSQWDYKNIVSTALRLSEFGWTYDFIEKHKDSIHSDYAENAWRYNMALWHYEKREFDRSLKLLHQVQFSDLFYNLGARSIILRVYYELEEEEPLRAHIESFKLYLKRNKMISDYHQTIYFNLLRFTLKLTKERQKLKMSRRKEPLRSFTLLEEKIRQNVQVAYRSWLLGQLDALKA